LSGDSRPSVADIRADLLAIYRAGLEAVDGHACVSRFLGTRPPSGTVSLVAIGKAACAMAAGARATLGARLDQALVITKTGHLAPVLQQDPRFVCREAGHPVPDADSLAAGQALVRFLQQIPDANELLVLISGGTSSLVEVLPEPVNLDALQALNGWLLGSGLPVQDINRVRCAVSRIKCGRLARWLGPQPVTVLLLSDVAGDDPAAIGSGLLYPTPARPLDEIPLPDWIAEMVHACQNEPAPVNNELTMQNHIIAGLGDALDAACRHARRLGYTATVVNPELSGDALQAGREIASMLVGKPAGAWLWGGETTVDLPPQAGRGGRCQSLALAAACALAGQEQIVLLAAGTDGSDGPGTVAGAMVDGTTLERGAASGLDAARCLQRADAGTFLEASGDLVVTGPTGTNVTDLVVAIKTG
jgi:hydroxypyruvate reductase